MKARGTSFVINKFVCQNSKFQNFAEHLNFRLGRWSGLGTWTLPPLFSASTTSFGAKLGVSGSTRPGLHLSVNISHISAPWRARQGRVAPSPRRGVAGIWGFGSSRRVAGWEVVCDDGRVKPWLNCFISPSTSRCDLR